MSQPDNEELLKKLGGTIKRVRKQKGLTLLDLEERTGIHTAMISKIELGKKNILITTLMRLADGLEVSVGELIG